MRKVEFPFSTANRLKLAAVVHREVLMRRLRAFLTGQQRPDVLSIDRVFGQRCSRKLSQRRQNIDRRGNLAALQPGRNLSRPASDERFATTAVPHRSLALSQWQCRAAVISVRQPRAVIRREDDHRVFVEAVLLQRFQNLPDRPVDLHNHVAVQAAF